MKWLFVAWLSIAVIAQLFGLFAKPKPKSVHMICHDGVCYDVESNGIQAPAYEWHRMGQTDNGMYVLQNGQAKEFRADELVGQRSEQ